MTKWIVLCLLATACTSASSTGIAPATCPTGSALTYANFGSSFVSTNCLSCHASRENPRLATQAQIQSNKAAILQNAVYTDAMPQDADLTTAERQMLGEWLACGAP